MNKLKIYLLTITALGMLSCSIGDADEETGTRSETEDLISNNFIPTLESWNINLPHTAVEWVHEIGSDGKLIKSYMYEKYPRRVVWELEYLEYNEEQLPTEYEKTYYSYGESYNVVIWDVMYNEEGTIEGITAYTDGVFSHEYYFNQLDDEKRVESYQIFDDTGEFAEREMFEYGEKGNFKSRTRYSTQAGNDESGLIAKWNYTYTSFGDYATKVYSSEESDATGETTYQYREDHTLQSSLYIGVSEGNPDYIYREEFDEEEKISSRSIIYGDQRWEYVAFFPNGDVEIVEFYALDELMWVETYAEDGSSEWKVFNPEDGTYRIEYFDEERTVYRVEYYDADGNLLHTDEYKNKKRAERELKPDVYPTPLTGNSRI